MNENKLNEFKRLLIEYGNFEFDCGEFKDDGEESNDDWKKNYEDISLKATNAKNRIIEYVKPYLI